MKRLFLTICLLTIVSSSRCYGGMIEIIDRTNNRVVGAQPGIHSGEEPLFASITVGSATATLHLGEYSEADTGLTATLTRANTDPAEWEAYISLLRVPFSPGLVRTSHLWLGLDTAKVGESGNTRSLPVAPPTFNLQQVDIKLTAYNRWYDNDNTYRVAEFSVTTYTLIPEPTCATLFLVLVVLSIAFRAKAIRSRT
jgi:hypothetical protein